MKKEITLEERKKIQLDMLVEIDAFCRSHNIKYILAFGTLLGAIRHKGYIPWDDDVDISMPLEDMIRFKKEFKSEKIIYCDVDTIDDYEWTFPRLAHKQTYNKCGLISKTYGINIDLYPMIEVSSSMKDNNIIINKLMNMFRLYCFLIKFRRRLIKLLPITKLVGFQYFVRKYRDLSFSLLSYKNGGAFHFDAGPLEKFELHTLNFNPFDKLIEVEFEGYKFWAPANYHKYLTVRYGDYMTPPPEAQRHPYHIAKYYWKKEN